MAADKRDEQMFVLKYGHHPVAVAEVVFDAVVNAAFPVFCSLAVERFSDAPFAFDSVDYPCTLRCRQGAFFPRLFQAEQLLFECAGAEKVCDHDILRVKSSGTGWQS